MPAVEITISGMLYDKLNRTTQNVVLIGEATLTGLGVGGGPVVPGTPPWYPGHPEHPIPPVIWPGPGTPPWYPGHPEHPIPPVIGGGPIIPVPPNTPNLPAPGSPPAMIGGSQPVHPMVPPPAIVVEYPGVGKVLVPLPTETVTAPVPPPVPTPT